VKAFTQEACNAFLRLFPGSPGEVTLLAHEWSAAPALSMLRSLKNLRTLFAVHTLERQRSDMRQEVSLRISEIELAALREARAVLVHEPATAEAAKFWLPECASRLVSARPVFPSQRFERALDPGAIKARYQVGPTDPTILFLGDLSEQYGPDLLLKAMPAILRNHKQARLVIGGCGDLFWPLKVYSRYLLLDHAVRIVGSVEGQTADELVQAADMVVVPSRQSTPWWPIQAAWAARRPVVATHEAAPQILEHERDCVRFFSSENSCVWGVERVLYDAAFAKAIAEAGRKKLEERFGWNILAEQVEELMGVPARS
jgi:glycosyltransferase involved in cell wall biosynthesis